MNSGQLSGIPSVQRSVPEHVVFSLEKITRAEISFDRAGRRPASGRAAERGWGWDLPGSAVAEGETAEAAAQRVLATAVLPVLGGMDERARRRYEYRGGAHLASTKSQLFVYGSVGGGGACAVGGAEWVDLDGAALGASYRLRQVQREPKLRRLHCG